MASKKQYLFASGSTTDDVQKAEVKPTECEALLTNLGLTDQNCTDSAEVQAWVKANKNRRYCPEATPVSYTHLTLPTILRV